MGGAWRRLYSLRAIMRLIRAISALPSSLACCNAKAQATAARDSVSGVNLDEEWANLVRFQQTYQAAGRVMSVAHDAPGLASSVNIGAFNLGNALGAIAGASVLNMGLSYTAVSFAGAGLSALALVLVLIQMKLAANKALDDYQTCS